LENETPPQKRVSITEPEKRVLSKRGNSKGVNFPSKWNSIRELKKLLNSPILIIEAKKDNRPPWNPIIEIRSPTKEDLEE